MTELAKQIVALRAEGLTYPQIQQQLGCSKGTISYHLGAGQKEKSSTRQVTNRANAKAGISPPPRTPKVKVLKPPRVRKPKPIKIPKAIPTSLTCSSCKKTFPVNAFTKNPKNQTTGRNTTCKKCASNRVVAYYKQHPERRTPNKRIRTNYGRHKISKELYDEMLSKYSGNCWICQTTPATSIDHDHTCCPGSVSCGKCVRGLLCSRCNMAIEQLGDNLDGLMRAVVYLQGKGL
jgi:hypothetical protein